jgi:hypothetical protein
MKTDFKGLFTGAAVLATITDTMFPINRTNTVEALIAAAQTTPQTTAQTTAQTTTDNSDKRPVSENERSSLSKSLVMTRYPILDYAILPLVESMIA